MTATRITPAERKAIIDIAPPWPKEEYGSRELSTMSLLKIDRDQLNVAHQFWRNVALVLAIICLVLVTHTMAYNDEVAAEKEKKSAKPSAGGVQPQCRDRSGKEYRGWVYSQSDNRKAYFACLYRKNATKS